MPTQTKVINLSFRALIVLTIIMAVGTYLRVVDVWRPIDGTATINSTLWRETDVASIAYNFYNEDNNILYPRTHWREDTPGFVESEFPLYPWLVAQSYSIFGFHEELARLLSLILSALTLLVLTRMSFMLFDEIGALIATAFFAVNPLLIYLSTAVQSDTLMFLFLSLALYYYFRHIREPSQARDFLISSAFLTLAILCKATAAPYALFFAADTLRRNGLRKTLTNKVTYIASAIIVLPNLAWVTHSHQFWLDYGLSLGVTNESHLIGSDILFMWKYYHGFLENSVSYVTSYPGGVALIVGLWTLRKSKLAKPIYILGASLSVFYFATLYTTGAPWAFYYHALTIPLAGIVLGAFGEEIALSDKRAKFGVSLIVVGIPTAVAGVGIGLALGFSLTLALALGSLTFTLAIAMLLYRSIFLQSESAGATTRKPSFTNNFVITVMAIVLVALTARSFRLVPQEKTYVDWRDCAERFVVNVPETSRLACWGAHSRSALGRDVAYNAAWMFYWMDRRGFSIPENIQSIAVVDSVRDLGADYYIEFLPGSARTPGFHQALRERYPMVDSCGVHMLYKLK